MKAKDRWRMNYKKQEAQWKRSISFSHSIFCNCGDYLNHFKCPSGGTGGGFIGADVSPGEGVSFITATPGTEDGEDVGGAEGTLR
nr:MAG: ORF2 [Torque teno polar bear virus 30]